MPSKPTYPNAELEAATYAELTAKPSSPLAEALCGSLLADLLHQQERKPSKKQVAAFGALMAELLARDPDDKGGWLFRSIGADSFTKSGIGYRPFIKLFDLMTPMMIDVAMGTRQWVQNELTAGNRAVAWQRATRFRANEWLRGWFAAEGITRESWADHFIRERKAINLRQSPILLRAAKSPRSSGRSKGRPMPLPPKDPMVDALVLRMNRLNDYLGGQAFEPFGPVFLRRIFSNGDQPGFAWNQGGRLYPLGTETHQSAKKQVRAAITINGKPTKEIDLRASHLTILVGLGHLPLSALEGDPYHIDGLPREVVKQWVTMTLSHGKRHRTWPKPAVDAFSADHGLNLRKVHPIRKVGDRVLEKLPIINADGSSSLANWGELQFRESEVMMATMETLAYKHDIPALPVHDSLIVPEGDLDLAIEVLKETFMSMVGVEPSVTVGGG